MALKRFVGTDTPTATDLASNTHTLYTVPAGKVFVITHVAVNSYRASIDDIANGEAGITNWFLGKDGNPGGHATYVGFATNATSGPRGMVFEAGDKISLVGDIGSVYPSNPYSYSRHVSGEELDV